jgi:peptide/nickel transport system substrate-binding protein
VGKSSKAGEPSVGGPHGGIRTFLIADVRGYTLFTQERGDEAAAKLAARFAGIAREVVEDHGGIVIELRGDEALAVFDSARQAIRAAVDAQKRFLEETVADRAFPLPVGIGLDAGEAVPIESGYRGGALNLAARLSGRAGPGETLASQGVVHLARRVEGVRYVDRGDLHLKGLADPVRVFRVISEEGDPAERMRQLAPRPARAPAPIRLARRHPAVAVIVALALIAAVAVPATIALRGGGSGERIVGDALALIDLDTGKLAGSVPLESRPGDVAVGEGGVWVTLPDRGAVVQIDPETMSVRDTVPVGADPSGIAVGGGSVWVSNSGSSTLSRISPETNSVVQTIEVPGGPAGLAVGREGVWVANSVNDSISHIDLETGKLVATIGVGDQPVDLAIDNQGVWVANAASGTVSRIDPARDLAVQRIEVGHGPQAIVAHSDGIWVANVLDGTVSRIDPDTNAVVQTIPVGRAPAGVALARGSVWVSDGSQGSMTRVEPQSGSVTTIPLGSHSGSFTAGGGTLWVSVRGSESAHRGGTLTTWALDYVFDTIDPALAYSPLTWSILALTSDGLVGFKRVGGVEGATLVPDLARSVPESTDGGRTYTFQLRPGIRYSNGDPLRPEDFRRAIERVFANLGEDGRPSGGVLYFSDIAGADECVPGKPCDLSDGIVGDDDAGTVTFHLTEPDPDFLYRLALPFAFAVPAATPDSVAGATPIPATGPYVIERYAAKREVVLARNLRFREWSEAAQPDGFPDRILWRLGSGLDQMVAKVLEGHADIMLPSPSPDRVAELLASSHAGQVHLLPAAHTYFMSLNEQAAPFDDIRVRRALNFAADRRAIEKVFGGTARTTCQILPPSFPGYVPYCPFTRHPDGTWTAPDLAHARELVDESGTAGSTVSVWATSEQYLGFPVPVGRYFVTLLRQLGYRAKLKVVGVEKYFAAVYGPSQRSRMAFLAWATDYASESGFITPTLTCDSPSNDSHFCDHRIERRIEEATRLQLTDPSAAHDLWSSIEHDIVERAPWVPLANRYWVNLVSQRLGNFQVNPQWGPLVDQMWVR